MDRSAILLQGLISNPESVTTEDLAWVLIIVKGIINGEMGDAVTIGQHMPNLQVHVQLRKNCLLSGCGRSLGLHQSYTSRQKVSSCDPSHLSVCIFLKG